jgi:hypothetical protein
MWKQFVFGGVYNSQILSDQKLAGMSKGKEKVVPALFLN